MSLSLADSVIFDICVYLQFTQSLSPIDDWIYSSVISHSNIVPIKSKYGRSFLNWEFGWESMVGTWRKACALNVFSYLERDRRLAISNNFAVDGWVATQRHVSQSVLSAEIICGSNITLKKPKLDIFTEKTECKISVCIVCLPWAIVKVAFLLSWEQFQMCSTVAEFVIKLGNVNTQNVNKWREKYKYYITRWVAT